MAIRSRRRGRERGWTVQVAAGFAAGVAATVFLLWLLGNHSRALAVVPGEPGGSRGSLTDAGWGGAVGVADGTAAESASVITEAGGQTAGGSGGAASGQQQQQQQLEQEQQQRDAQQQLGDQQQGKQQQSERQAQQQAEGQQRGQAQVSVPLPNLDEVPHLFLSFGNAAYFELAHNWAKSVQAIGAPYIIAAFDNEMMGRCAEVGLVCTKIEFGQSADFRGDFAAFRAMGAVKVRFALSILEEHPNLPLVVVSDTDTVWLRQPWDYFKQRESAEFFISSDCLSHELEERWSPHHGQPRCGHIPGDNDARAFNTGLFATRNTLAARGVLRAWADMLVDPTKEQADDPMHRGIDDQLAMNQLLETGGLPQASAEDPRTVLAFNRSLFLQTLPVALFSNGHVAFVQRIPWNLGISPIVIHATFQRHNIVGKKARLREFHLWHMDPPQYYGRQQQQQQQQLPYGTDSGGGLATASQQQDGTQQPQQQLRLLGYENRVLEFVAQAERDKYGALGRRMPLLEKNWLGMSYQLAALRDALAVSNMLSRTVLLPQLWCWCDNDEHPHILMRCRIKGTDYETPFKCPLDFLISPGALDYFNMAYRHAGFLDHPQVPYTLRHSRAIVRIADSKPGQPFPEPRRTVGHAATVWPGIRAKELLAAVQLVDSAAVLQLRGHVPGFFAGWDEDEQFKASAFDTLFFQVAADAKWCCFAWGDADEDYQEFPYRLPEPLAAPWHPWKAPQLEMPQWCDLVSTKHGNRDFTLLPQHPCTFLRNATAADIAADDSGHFNVPWIM